MTEHLDVDTPHGPGRWHLDATDTPRGVLLLGQGAGGGIDQFDLQACADLLPAHGISVARFDQPWHVAGKKVASRPPVLDECWLAGVEALRPRLPDVPLVTGGRSAGARVACRTAGRVGANGVVCLAFPLHPPGKPEKSRLDELLTPSVPVLVVQGTRDAFGGAALVQQSLPADASGRVTVAAVEGAGHPLTVAQRVRGAEEHRAMLVDLILDWWE